MEDEVIFVADYIIEKLRKDKIIKIAKENKGYDENYKDNQIHTQYVLKTGAIE